MAEKSPSSRSRKKVVAKRVKAMDPALREVYKAIKADLIKGESERVRSRYAIGQQILKVKRSRKKYGQKAVEKLAQALAVNSTTLYRYADVAEQWTPTAFEKLQKQRDAVFGRPLSWSALVEIAELADADDRKRLVEDVLREGLTIRDLRRRKQEILGHQISRPTAPQWAVTMRLGEVLELSRVVLKKAEGWDETVFAALRSVGPDDNPGAVLGRLEQAETAQRQVRDLCDENLKKLADGRKHINRQCDAKRASGAKKKKGKK